MANLKSTILTVVLGASAAVNAASAETRRVLPGSKGWQDSNNSIRNDINFKVLEGGLKPYSLPKAPATSLDMQAEMKPKLSRDAALKRLQDMETPYAAVSTDPIVVKSVNLMFQVARSISSRENISERQSTKLFSSAIDTWKQEGETRSWIRPSKEGRYHIGDGFGAAGGGGAYEAASRLAGMRTFVRDALKNGMQFKDIILPRDYVFGKYDPALDEYYEKVICALEKSNMKADAVTGTAFLPLTTIAGKITVSDMATDCAVFSVKAFGEYADLVAPQPEQMIQERTRDMIEEYRELGPFTSIDKKSGSIVWPLSKIGDSYTIVPRHILNPDKPVPGMRFEITQDSGSYVATFNGQDWKLQTFADNMKKDVTTCSFEQVKAIAEKE